MTKRRIVLVCAFMGLTTAGGFVVLNAVARGIYNCSPDPYFFESCEWQSTPVMAISLGPWLVATYLLARREALYPFACLCMGFMWWLGLLPLFLFMTYEVPRHSPSGVLTDILETSAALVVVSLLTAGVGSAMQAVIRMRRRRRLPKAA